MKDLAILIPYYNDQDVIGSTLDSIVETDNRFKVFLVNDGSATLPSLPKKYKFEVEIIDLPSNLGITGALNKGLEKILSCSNYNYIARLDCGDLCAEGRFRKQYDIISNDKDLMLLGANVEFFLNHIGDGYKTSLPVESESIKRLSLLKSCFIHPSVVFDVNYFKIEGRRYSEDFPCAEDFELFNAISKKYKTKNIEDVLVYCLDRPDGISQSKRKQQLKTALKVIVKYFDYGNYFSYLALAKVLTQFILPRGFFNFVKNYTK